MEDLLLYLLWLLQVDVVEDISNTSERTQRKVVEQWMSK